MTNRTLTAILATFSLLVCLRAHAQPAAAVDLEAGRHHFDRGVEYYRDGNVTAALIEFKRAYATAPNYRVLYNLGQVSNTLGDYTAAESYFQQYLKDGGAEIDSARRRDLENTLGKLAGRITTVNLTCNVAGAELFVDDVSVGTSPLAEPVRVSAGTRRLSAAISGRRRAARAVEAAGGESLAVRLVLEPDREELPPLAQTTPSGSVRESSGPGAAMWLGIATGALAVGAGVMGTLAVIDGSKYHDALHRSATARELDSLHDRAQVKAISTDILLGATAVTGIITVVALIANGGEEHAPRAATSRAHEARVSLGLGTLLWTSHFE
jgi:tetratricopeptide (TPR) repeat protein